MQSAIYIYYTPDWQELADLVLPRVYAYCLKHDYASEIHCENISDLNCGFYKMYELYQTVRKYDCVWVLDLDTLITNSSIKFTDFVDDEHDIFICNDIHGINAGSWIIRNTKYARVFLWKVITEYDDAPEEQTVMKRYLDMVRVKYLPHPSINSYKYELYKDEIGERIMRHDEGQWQPDDLLLHLPGLPYEKKLEIIKEMA